MEDGRPLEKAGTGRRQGLGADAGHPRRRLDLRHQELHGFPPPPGSAGEYAGLDLHAGLICLNGPVGMDLSMQVEIFVVALDDLDAQPDLVNQVLEITLENDADLEMRVARYALPAEGQG